MTMAENNAMRGLTEGLFLETYKSLCGKLEGYFLNMDLFEARKDVLSFVRGLRFSALLIYAIRKILKGTRLTASWGVVLTHDGKRCSPECDVIIHSDEWKHAWNGDDNVGKPVMDFRFVLAEDVKLVISCKSELYSGIDENIKKYALNLKDHVSCIWLFAERCKKDKVGQYQEEAVEAGYEKFYYLYAFEERGVGQEYNEPAWFEFAETLRSLDQ